MTKPIHVGTMQRVSIATGEPVGPPEPGLQLVPPEPGKCQICAVAHEPTQAHNAQSLYYQMRFYALHQRWPTWADAVAHCAPYVRDLWRAELAQRKRWTEPPASTDPIAEPGGAA